MSWGVPVGGSAYETDGRTPSRRQASSAGRPERRSRAPSILEIARQSLAAGDRSRSRTSFFSVLFVAVVRAPCRVMRPRLMTGLVLARDRRAPRRHRLWARRRRAIHLTRVGLSDNLGMDRPSAELRIPVSGRTTAEVTTQLLAATAPGPGVYQKLVVRQHRDGSLGLHVPQDKGRNKPVLRATVQGEDGATALRGVARESRQRRLFDRLVQFWAFLMAVLAVPFVATRDWPGAAICGLGR